VSRYEDFGSSLRDLPRLRSSRRRRASSWDRSGGNDDRLHLEPGVSATLAEIGGAGSINHIWITVANEHLEMTPNSIEPDFLRRLLLRMFWDGEEEPSRGPRPLRRLRAERPQPPRDQPVELVRRR